MAIGYWHRVFFTLCYWASELRWQKLFRAEEMIPAQVKPLLSNTLKYKENCTASFFRQILYCS